MQFKKKKQHCISEYHVLFGASDKEKLGVMYSNGTLEFAEAVVKSKIRTPVSKPFRVQRINLSTNW